MAKRVNVFVHANTYLSLLVLYYALAFITPEKKVFVAFSVLFVVSLWFMYRRWNIALVLGYFALIPFAVGQVYKFQILAPYQLFFDPHYPEGRNLFFVISPAFLIGITVLVKTMRSLRFDWIRRGAHKEVVFFLATAFVMFLSSLQPSHNQGFSLLLGLQYVILLAWLVLALVELEERRLVVNMLCLTAVAAAALNSSIALLQTVKRGPIGTILEQRVIMISEEISVSFFRPFGLESHPNFLANTLLFGIFISLFLAHTSWVRYRNVLASAGFIACVGLILTQSRAGYLGLAGGMVPLVIVYAKQARSKMIQFLAHRFTAQSSVAGIVFIILFIFFVLGRFYNTLLFSFGEGGAFSVRNQLIKEAMAIIQEKPLLGIGPGMFIAEAYDKNITGVMRWFPEAVHNGFLLIASESGIFALILSIGTLYFVFRRLVTNKKNVYARAAIGGYVISQIIFMWFHPVNNIITPQMALIILLLL